MLIFIILGIIQGITEPIPVSSSGHLLIIQNILNNNINYTILALLTNLGSLLAILYLFKEDVKYNIKNNLFEVIVGTIPALVLGFIITKINIFDVLESNIKFIGVTLLITALFLFIIRNKKGTKNNVSIKDSFVIGMYQAIALIPGISRSGATIYGGLANNLTKELAFTFSFMLYIPISIITGILGIKELFNTNLTTNEMMLYVLSMIISFIFTYISTKWFKNIVIKGKLIYFVIYCLILGSTIICFV